MEKITILCPYHHEEEELMIPDSYIGTAYNRNKTMVFEGDIPCNPNPQKPLNKPGILQVKIHFRGATTPWVERIAIKN